MKPYPNFKYFYKGISAYLDNVRYPPRNQQGGKEFFFELVYRSLKNVMRNPQYDGIGDLKSIRLNLVEDFNASNVCLATQYMSEERNIEDFGLILPQEPLVNEPYPFFEKDLVMQTLQESSGLLLLDMYLGDVNRQKDMLGPVSTIVSTIGDWKAGRCAFYRYLTYCGFLQVDDSAIPSIIEDSIPRLSLLSRLANRFLDVSEIREAYRESDVDKEGALAGNAMAENFLRFNGVKEEKFHSLST